MSLSDSGTGRSRLPLETLAIAVFVLLLVFVVFYALSQRQQALRASPAGFDGLQNWLASEGVSAQSFLGGWQVDQTSVGVLVLPLFDTVPDRARSHPRTKQELLFQQDEYDLEMGAVLEKIRRVQVLAVLPKWRSGMRLAGVAHPILLNERPATEQLLRQLTGQDSAQIVEARIPFSDFSYRTEGGQAMAARIYAAQMFTSPNCTPLIGTQEAMLLAECSVSPDQTLERTQDQAGGHTNGQTGGHAGGDREEGPATPGRLLVLSDPDLLNNHGLRMADNAVIARDLLMARAGTGNVMIDYSRGMWLTDPQRRVHRERTWADLKRFFGPPFLTLWLGGFLTLLLFVWRGWLRYGPLRQMPAAGSSGKALALQARARLMRLCDQDGALIGDYALARLAATAATLFGPAHARHYAEPKAFLGYVARRHPARAAALETVLATIQNLPPRTSPAEAIRHVDELEALLEQIIHDT